MRNDELGRHIELLKNDLKNIRREKIWDLELREELGGLGELIQEAITWFDHNVEDESSSGSSGIKSKVTYAKCPSCKHVIFEIS